MQELSATLREEEKVELLGTGDWPDPEPINTTLLPVDKLPQDIIPDPLRAWAVDVAHRMQAPIDFLAVALMIMAGTVIGAGCGIRPKKKDDWLVIPNLWGGVVGRPGTLKTPALQEALKPLSSLEQDAKTQFDETMREHEAEQEVFKARRDALKDEMKKASRKEETLCMDDVKTRYVSLEEPQKPAWTRFKTNDATIEKIAELLVQNPRGLLIFRDEIVGLLASWDKEGREPDRAFYLEAWNGFGSITVDRIGRGTVHVDNLCISILGGIQPAKLMAYLHQATSELQNDGLIQRLQLLVYPDVGTNWELVDEHPDKEANSRATHTIERLACMDFTEGGATLDEGERIPYLHFDSDAQSLFYEWIQGLEDKLIADEPPVVLEHLAKYRSLMPSLALIDHLVAVADGAPTGPVTLDSAERAAAWCSYLESHMRRIYGLVGNIGQRAAAELAKKIRTGGLQDEFTLRDVYRKGWHLLTSKDVVRSACEELVDANWLRAHIPEGGKTRTAYYINPKIPGTYS